DALLVSVGEPLAELERELDRLLRLEAALGLYDLGEVLSLDVVHREVVDLVDLAHVVNGDDRAVRELGRVLRLGEEAVALALARRVPHEEHLERDRPVEVRLPRAEDDSHAAAPELGQELVTPERRADLRTTAARRGHERLLELRGLLERR